MDPRSHAFGPAKHLPPGELDALWDRYVSTRDGETRDGEAVDRLVDHYMPLVYQTALNVVRQLPNHVDVQDLISAGSLGLADALGKFDPERGNQFSTYATQRIWGAIYDDLRSRAWQSRQAMQNSRRLETGREELLTKLGRPPSDEELARHLGMTSEEFSRFSRNAALRSMVPLDGKWGEGEDEELGPLDAIADDNEADPLDHTMRMELKAMLARGLSHEEKTILAMYYDDDLTFKEIAVTLDLSESRVSQIHKAMLERLREKLAHMDVHSPEQF